MSAKKDIKTIFKENNRWYEWWTNSDGTIDVSVEWGDWKHDHLFLSHIMRENNYFEVNESVTEEDGSDAYSSIHTFKYMGN